jgi:hypothetical protein
MRTTAAPARLRRVAGIVGLLAAVLGAGSVTAAIAQAQAQAPLPMVGSPLSQDEILKHVRAAAITSLRPVGSTSVVFAAKLKAGVDASFKPRQQAKPLGYRAEIAAYRVARLLAFDNVPPAVSRAVGLVQIRERLAPEFQAAAPEFERALITEASGGVAVVPGAATYWVPDLRDLGLDSPRRMERWTRHLLQSGAVRAEERSWHADLSNMLVFDYLIGNGDRWSGANVQGLKDGSRIVIRDHDLAFPETLKKDRHAVLFAALERTEKFSRRTVERLRALSEASLRAELGRDPRARVEPILSDAQIAGVLERRAAIMSLVSALVEEFGEERVLAFE